MVQVHWGWWNVDGDVASEERGVYKMVDEFPDLVAMKGQQERKN